MLAAAGEQLPISPERRKYLDVFWTMGLHPQYRKMVQAQRRDLPDEEEAYLQTLDAEAVIPRWEPLFVTLTLPYPSWKPEKRKPKRVRKGKPKRWDPILFGGEAAYDYL